MAREPHVVPSVLEIVLSPFDRHVTERNQDCVYRVVLSPRNVHVFIYSIPLPCCSYHT